MQFSPPPLSTSTCRLIVDQCRGMSCIATLWNIPLVEFRSQAQGVLLLALAPFLWRLMHSYAHTKHNNAKFIRQGLFTGLKSAKT